MAIYMVRAPNVKPFAVRAESVIRGTEITCLYGEKSCLVAVIHNGPGVSIVNLDAQNATAGEMPTPHAPPQPSHGSPR
jgi:hypothetical protein